MSDRAKEGGCLAGLGWAVEGGCLTGLRKVGV